MFRAIVQGEVDTRGYSFFFEQFDTAKLNQLALSQKYDVCAISAAAFNSCSDSYSILPHGASVGRNFGPVVVAKNKVDLNELNNLTVATPGDSTTASAVLRKIAPKAKQMAVPIEPYSRVFEVLERGEVDAALLIHEGQISYKKYDLEVIVDTGQWWFDKYDLPLPLGINVIKKALGVEAISEISEIISSSIKHGLENKKEVLNELVELNRVREADLQSVDGVEEYLDRYANQDTFLMDDDCRKALEVLLGGQLSFVENPRC